jgi:hypothetical protein
VIWDPDLVGEMGPQFGTLFWVVTLIFRPQKMGVHPTFRTPILELMPNVISKIIVI